MTLDGSVEWPLLNDAQQRKGGKFWALLKEVGNQLSMICGNWQGILLECPYTAYSVSLVCLPSKKQEKCIIMFIAFTTQSECSRSRPNSFHLSQIWHSVTPNYFCCSHSTTLIISFPFFCELEGFPPKTPQWTDSLYKSHESLTNAPAWKQYCQKLQERRHCDP